MSKHVCKKDHCNLCHNSFSDCLDNCCGELLDFVREDAWDEGYNTCAKQRISEQEGWQTGEPTTEEGPFLLEVEDSVTKERKYKTADYYVPAKSNSEKATNKEIEHIRHREKERKKRS